MVSYWSINGYLRLNLAQGSYPQFYDGLLTFWLVFDNIKGYEYRLTRKDYLISTQFLDKDLLSRDGKSKYQGFKPNSRLRANGVLSFLKGSRQETAILSRLYRLIGIIFLIVSISFFVSDNAVAEEGSFFSSNPLNWVKAQISNILPGDESDNQQSSDGQSLIVSQNSYVIKTSPPDATNTDTDQRRSFVIDYDVKDGDTLTRIADNFGISLNTLIWANDLSAKSIIKEGQELKILPIDGVLYIVKKGDNLSEITKKYKAEMEDIIDFNDLPADGLIKEGMDLILPNAVMPSSSIASTSSKSTAKSGSVSQKVVSVVSSAKQKLSTLYAEAEKFFIIPVSGRITQGRHSYTPPAVDIGNACGTPVFASADGTVTVARQTTSRSSRAEGGYGNNVRIQHSNGALSLYSHLLYGSLLVNEGDYVKQGQKIAEIGGGWEKRGLRMKGAGRSTGCHLHYEVRNGTNLLVNTAKYRKGIVIETPAAKLAIDDSNVGAGDTNDSDSDNNGTGFSGVISEPYKGN